MTHTTARRGLGRCVVAAVGAVVTTAMLLTGCSAVSRSPTGNNAATGRNFGADRLFDLSPRSSFHTLSDMTGSIPTNSSCLDDMIMLPGGICNWEKQQYYYLLADEPSAPPPDGLTFNYKVREGLKWSDGLTLTAKDVYSTSVMRYAMQQPAFNYIKDIELVDDSNIKLILNSPAPITVH